MQLIKLNVKFPTKIFILGLFLFNTQIGFGQNPEIQKFIGTWMRDGRVVLIIKAQGDILALESPTSAKSEIQFNNVQVKNGKLTFEKNFTKKDGSIGRYYFEMSEDPDGIMMDQLSSTPSFEKATAQTLIKLENYLELTAFPQSSSSTNTNVLNKVTSLSHRPREECNKTKCVCIRQSDYYCCKCRGIVRAAVAAAVGLY